VHRVRKILENYLNIYEIISWNVNGWRIVYGPTSAIDYNGTVVDQVPLMKTGMVIVDTTFRTFLITGN
jgi:hypothetical protein